MPRRDDNTHGASYIFYLICALAILGFVTMLGAPLGSIAAFGIHIQNILSFTLKIAICTLGMILVIIAASIFNSQDRKREARVLRLSGIAFCTATVIVISVLELQVRQHPDIGTIDDEIGQELAYSASGSQAEGATVVEFVKNGFVEQDFMTSKLLNVTKIAIRTSRDPSLGSTRPTPGCPQGAIGKVKYQVKDSGGNLIARVELPACRDADTVWNLPSPIILTPGQKYTLTITNIGNTTISIYFNSNRSRAGGETRLTGAVDPQGQSVPYGKAVSGAINAI